MERIEKLDINKYHQHPAIGSSDLKLINQSLNHYLRKNEIEKKEDESLLIGQALHDCLLSYDDIFSKSYTVMPDEITRKAGKKWEEFEEENRGKTILSKKQSKKVVDMLRSLNGHPLFEKFNPYQQKTIETEVTYFSTMQNVAIKCRPDMEGKTFIADLKTSAKSVTENRFAKTIFDYRYHVQAAWYLDLVNEYRKQNGISLVTNYFFIAVENVHPHNCNIFRLHENAIEEGRRLYQLDFLKYKKYLENKDYFYTGLNESVISIDIPKYAYFTNDFSEGDLENE